MPLRWLYPAKAEPLNNDPETTTSDKWMPVCPDQPGMRVKAALLAAIVAGSFFAPANMEASQTGGAVAGSISYTQRFQYQGSVEPFPAAWSAPPEDVSIDKWEQPTDRPVLPRSGREAWRSNLPYQAWLVPNQIDPTSNQLGKWYRPLSEPVRRAPSLLQEGWSVACAVETPELYQWQQPTARPVQPRPYFNQTNQFSASTEPIPADRPTLEWLDIAVGPIPQIVRPTQHGWITADPHQIARTVTEWLTPIVQPIRLQPVVTEGATLIDPTALMAATVDVTAYQMAWLPKYPDYIPCTQDLQYLYESWSGDLEPTNTSVETLTMDKWWSPTSEPVRILPELVREGFSGPESLQAILTPTDVEVTIDKWIGSQPDQIRDIRSGKFYWQGWTALGQAAFAVTLDAGHVHKASARDYVHDALARAYVHSASTREYIDKAGKLP